MKIKILLLTLLFTTVSALPSYAARFARQYSVNLQVSFTGIGGTRGESCQYTLRRSSNLGNIAFYKSFDCDGNRSTATLGFSTIGTVLLVIPYLGDFALTDGISIFALTREVKISCDGNFQSSRLISGTCNGTTEDGFVYNGTFTATQVGKK